MHIAAVDLFYILGMNVLIIFILKFIKGRSTEYRDTFMKTKFCDDNSFKENFLIK